MKVKLNELDIEYFMKSEEGRAYLEYNDKVGGRPIGPFVPFVYPPGVEEMGGVIAVYKECIKRGITWEELLDFKPIPDDGAVY